MNKYKVIVAKVDTFESSASSESLAVLVNDAIRDGYLPLGGVCVAPHPKDPRLLLFMQAVTRYEPGTVEQLMDQSVQT
jgi:hypothetical protein